MKNRLTATDASPQSPLWIQPSFAMKLKITLSLLIALFFYTHSADAFHSVTTGKWISRDPLSEEVFYLHYRDAYRTIKGWPRNPPVMENPYAFVANSPICETDLDGCRLTPNGDVAIDNRNRRSPPGGMRLIRVPKCTVLFVYGHNFANDFTKDGLQWIWNIVPANDTEKDCSYAAVAGCAANLVPNEIPLPGFKYSDYDVGDQGTIGVTTLLQMWDDVRNKLAPDAAKGLRGCSCNCKTVTLMWTKIGGGLPDLKPDFGTVPLP